MLNNIKILYEDNYYIVADKPAGLLSTPTPKKEKFTLVDLINKEYKGRGEERNIYLCHRLDRDTSGVIVLAKGKGAQKKLMQEFHQGRVEKKYIAFAHGRIKQRQGNISFPIEGKKAVTIFRVLNYVEKGFSNLEIETLTGRTNQIRIHLKMAGHPLVGERKFAFARDYKLKFRRAALHAKFISFKHPFSGKTITVRATLADDMRKLS